MDSILKNVKTRTADHRKVCDSDLCKALQRYDVPDAREQPDHLEEYLQGASHGNRQFDIGTPVQVKLRTSCPVCCFLWKKMKEEPEFSNADKSAPCYVNIDHVFFLAPSFKTSLTGVATYTNPARGLGERNLIVDNSTHQNAKLGRLIDPNVSVSQRLQRWLGQCESQHADTCPPTDSKLSGDRPGNLRVVDLIEKCLVKIPWQQRYAALSYTWGSCTPPKLYMKDLSLLSTPGSLLNLRERMPRTIRDAMVLVTEVGLRFLWFDSLCLMQDSPADLKKGIMNMDAVYESAWFTIIAAQGSGADAGLPGVTQFPREIDQDCLKLKDGFGILRASSLDHYLNRSTYASRGWT